jgi:predicted nucleotidyltransferase
VYFIFTYDIPYTAIVARSGIFATKKMKKNFRREVPRQINYFPIFAPSIRITKTMDNEAIRDRIKANVLEVNPEAEVWLYGSRARGTAREDSDWDVLVLTPDDKLSVQEEGRFIDHICDLMVKTGQVIQLFAYGKQDWHNRHSITPFYHNVQREAIRL